MTSFRGCTIFLLRTAAQLLLPFSPCVDEALSLQLRESATFPSSTSNSERGKMDETKADFPPSSPPLPDDYSDVESAHSAEEDAATERRKHQRGGRKKSTTQTTRESRMPPVPASEVGTEPSHREEFSLEHGDTQINGGSRMNGKISTTRVEQDPEMEMETQTEMEGEGRVCPECAARKQQAAPATQQAERKQPSPFDTGIRAFNLKRAADSAGRPVSVRAEKKRSKKKEKEKEKQKEKARKKKKKREPDVDETDESSSDEDEEKEPETRPGMAIRLDLNLIVEIFLKAKIQGDVTITFL